MMLWKDEVIPGKEGALEPRFPRLMRTGFSLAILGVLALGLAAPARAQSAFDDPGARATTGGKAGALADLVPTTPNIDAGNISIGATAQVVVLFRNDSGRALQAGAINLYPSSTVSASISLNECSNGEDLPAGAVCAVGLSIKGLQAGRWRVEMLMRHSGITRLTTATLQGNVEETEGSDQNVFKSDIEAIPAELDFEQLSTSQPAVQPVVLRNITSTAIDIESIYVEAAEQAGFSFRTDCSTLGPGQACIVTMIWSPILKGQATGVLVVEHTGPTSVSSVPLLGEFNPDEVLAAKVFPEAVPGKGLLVSSQDRVDFGAGINTASSITVSLVNVGDSPVTIENIRLAGGDNGLSMSQSGCTKGIVLDPVQACPLTVSWNPVREGDILDDIQVIHDGARGILVMPVRGTATGIVSTDNRALRLAAGEDTASIAKDGDIGSQIIIRDKDMDPGTVLDGFVVTSHSSKRSIITGPGGSRIVFDGEEVVIGGFPWSVNIRSSGVEFRSGDEKVLLLFDRALSAPTATTSRNSSTSAGAASTTGSAPAASASTSN